jgi:hypothetical protein
MHYHRRDYVSTQKNKQAPREQILQPQSFHCRQEQRRRGEAPQRLKPAQRSSFCDMHSVNLASLVQSEIEGINLNPQIVFI